MYVVVTFIDNQTQDRTGKDNVCCPPIPLCVSIVNGCNASGKDCDMSRTRNRKSPSPAKGKGKRGSIPSFGRVLQRKGKDADARTQIESLLSELQDAKDAKDRDAQKGIRRRLRSLGYWGGTRTRVNWIGRVPDAKRKDVVSL
jgi:hypothetical protein